MSYRPPFDEELESVLDVVSEQVPSTITAESIPDLRADPLFVLTEEVLEENQLEVRDVWVESFDGAQILVSVLQPKGRSGRGPGFYFVHGGGMIFGDRWTGAAALFDWLHRYNAVAVTVEYRLAPEHPDPTPVEDCYAGLMWMWTNASTLGIDQDRIIIVGASAGGGLAAGSVLLARDRSGPRLAGQLLMYPMLDDRDRTDSTKQFDGVGVWGRGSNRVAWTAVLGSRRGTEEVSPYAAPARSSDLSNLPPALIDCGSAEVFRDEDVAYASAIWAAGGSAELHVWPGGFHSFEVFAPEARLSKEMVTARRNWVDRVLRRASIPDGEN